MVSSVTVRTTETEEIEPLGIDPRTLDHFHENMVLISGGWKVHVVDCRWLKERALSFPREEFVCFGDKANAVSFRVSYVELNLWRLRLISSEPFWVAKN